MCPSDCLKNYWLAYQKKKLRDLKIFGLHPTIFRGGKDWWPSWSFQLQHVGHMPMIPKHPVPLFALGPTVTWFRCSQVELTPSHLVGVAILLLCGQQMVQRVRSSIPSLPCNFLGIRGLSCGNRKKFVSTPFLGDCKIKNTVKQSANQCCRKSHNQSMVN